jgi:hypothetical protein
MRLYVSISNHSLFSSSSEVPMEVDQAGGIRGLSSDLSAEKIAQLRTKRQKVLSRPIPTHSDEILDPLANLPIDGLDDGSTKEQQECEATSSTRLQLYASSSSFDVVPGYFAELKVGFLRRNIHLNCLE